MAKIACITGSIACQPRIPLASSGSSLNWPFLPTRPVHTTATPAAGSSTSPRHLCEAGPQPHLLFVRAVTPLSLGHQRSWTLPNKKDTAPAPTLPGLHLLDNRPAHTRGCPSLASASVFPCVHPPLSSAACAPYLQVHTVACLPNLVFNILHVQLLTV